MRGVSTPATLESPSLTPNRATYQPRSDQHGFLPFSEWEGDKYDEEPPKYCYTIEWKVVLNSKMVGRVTEENLISP